MNGIRPRPGGLPLVPCPDFLAWYVDGDGIVRASDGTAREVIGADVARVIGQDYRTALAPFEGAVRRIERALAGESVAEFGDTWGRRWFNIVTPSRCGWGVDGWSVMLPDGAGGDVRSIYESVDRVPEFGIEPGDRFVRRERADGVSVVRHWDEDRWRDYLSDRPDRIRALLSPSPAVHPLPPPATPPILRIVPRQCP